MTNLIQTVTAIATVLGPFVGGGGMWAYMSARHKAKQGAPAAMLASQAGLVEALNNQTKALLSESAKDRRDLKRRVDRQGLELTRVRNEVSQCQERHKECESGQAELKAQIDHLMKGRVATYPHKGAEE